MNYTACFYNAYENCLCHSAVIKLWGFGFQNEWYHHNRKSKDSWPSMQLLYITELIFLRVPQDRGAHSSFTNVNDYCQSGLWMSLCLTRPVGCFCCFAWLHVSCVDMEGIFCITLCTICSPKYPLGLMLHLFSSILGRLLPCQWSSPGLLWCKVKVNRLGLQ